MEVINLENGNIIEVIKTDNVIRGKREKLYPVDDYCELNIEEYLVPCVRITEGLKVYMLDKDSCLDLEKKLNELGIKTRIGCACETDMWSIYIISVPDELIGTEKKL